MAGRSLARGQILAPVVAPTKSVIVAAIALLLHPGARTIAGLAAFEFGDELE